VAKVIKPNQLASALSDIVNKHKDVTKDKLNKALRISTIKVWGDIIKLTPVDSGRARGNWFVGLNVTDDTSGKNKNKGPSYVAKELPKDLTKQKIFLFNNLPYIEKLEFGGYGNKDTEKTNAQGFSKLAPKGFVRVSLLKWGSTLRKAFKSVGG